AGPDNARVRIEWWFGLTPERIDANHADSSQVAAAVFTDQSGAQVTIAADDVITAVGFSENPDSPVPAAMHTDGRVEAGLYVAGWLRRGPRGTIPDQRTDAKGLAQTIVDDMRSGSVSISKPGLETVTGETDYDGWRRI